MWGVCAQRSCDPGVPTMATATAAPSAWLLLGARLGLLVAGQVSCPHPSVPPRSPRRLGLGDSPGPRG